jgi:hypothetical protein
MRFRAVDLRPARLASAADAPNPGLVRLLHRVPPGTHGRRLVATRADLGSRPDAESVAALRARRSVLGDGPMILHLTPKTAALVGETPAEWEILETQVRAGRWTTGARTDEGRLRVLAAALGVALSLKPEAKVLDCPRAERDRARL